MTKIWYNRIQNELLQLKPQFQQKDSDPTTNDAVSLIPECVTLQHGDHELDLQRGVCVLAVEVSVSVIQVVPKYNPNLEKCALDSSGNTAAAADSGSAVEKKERIVACLKINVSEQGTNFPFLPPQIHLISLRNGDTHDLVSLPPNSTIVLSEELTDQNLLDFDLDWTPNLTLGHVIQHLALKLRETILQNEPILADPHNGTSVPNNMSEYHATGADVYQSEVSELTENYKVGKQKLTEYFHRFTQQIDTFLDDVDDSANASDANDLSTLCDAYYEAEIIDQNAAKAEARQKSGFGSMTSWAASLLAPKKYLALTVDGNHLLYVMDNGSVLQKYDLDKLQKLKFRRGESISLFFQMQMGQELTVALFNCKESLTLAKGIQVNLQKIGIQGKHTDVKKRTALQNAQNLVDLASIKIQNIEQASSNASAKEVEEVMGILRDAAENYAYCDDQRHADVLQMLHKFLNLDVVRRILSEDPTDEKVQEGDNMPADKLPSKDNVDIHDSSEMPSEASTTPINTLKEIDSPANKKKDIPPPEGEVIEATPCMLFDDDDEHLSKNKSTSKHDDEVDEVGQNDTEKILASDSFTENMESMSTDTDDVIEEGVMSTELTDFLKQADAELESLMKS